MRLSQAIGQLVRSKGADHLRPDDGLAIDAMCLDAVDTVANPVGGRGLAEAPIIPTAPAIANAVSDALGVPLNDLPLTPWRVLAALGT